MSDQAGQRDELLRRMQDRLDAFVLYARPHLLLDPAASHDSAGGLVTSWSALMVPAFSRWNRVPRPANPPSLRRGRFMSATRCWCGNCYADFWSSY